MKIVATSDWHGRVPHPSAIPPCDVLVLAGDICPGWAHNHDDAPRQLAWLETKFADWCRDLPAVNSIVMIAGNHDHVFEVFPRAARDAVEAIPSLTYLCDDSVVLDGTVLYGVPWVPTIGPRWAFRGTERAAAAFDAVPAETDVVVAHGPPYGVLDHTVPEFGDADAGDEAARAMLDRVRPKVYICGHIHEQGGRRQAIPLNVGGQPWWEAAKCEVLNVAHVDEMYEPKNAPLTIEV